MLKYIVKRISVFIPTLFAVSLIAFIISVNSPGDPVETLRSKGSGESQHSQSASAIKAKSQLRHELGLDLPVFYFTLSSAASPDTLYKIYNPGEKETLSRLIDQSGNWDYVSAYFKSLQNLRKIAADIHIDSIAIQELGKENIDDDIDDAQQLIQSLFLSHEEVVILSKFDKLKKILGDEKTASAHSPLSALDKAADNCRKNYLAIRENSSYWKTFIPVLHFYGNNQYHRWLFGDGNPLTGKNYTYTKGVLRGDFGRSFTSKLNVSEIIGDALPWSLLFTFLSVALAYLVSIPIGIKAADKRGGMFDRTSSLILFMLYSLPVFFMATLLLMTFANPHVLSWFPANGIKPGGGYPEGISMWQKIKLSFPYIVLPLLSYTYSSFAFLSRTMRVSMLEVLGQDYIRTAKAKGLSHYRVLYKHGFRNALIPIITVFSSVLPAAVGGSVIIESIFGVPGMGQVMFGSIYARDYSVIVAVFTLSGFLTLTGYFIADMLYAIVDPRITYSK